MILRLRPKEVTVFRFGLGTQHKQVEPFQRALQECNKDGMFGENKNSFKRLLCGFLVVSRGV